MLFRSLMRLSSVIMLTYVSFSLNFFFKLLYLFIFSFIFGCVGVKLSRVAGLDCMLGCCEGWVDTKVFVVMVWFADVIKKEELVVLIRAKSYLYQNGEILIKVEKTRRKTKEKRKKKKKKIKKF